MALRPAFIIVFAAALGLAVFAVQYSEDVCIHAMILETIIQSPLFPEYYQPLDVRLTYPPLFHYLAYPLALIRIDILTATRIAGIMALSVFSAGCYLLAERHRKGSGIYAGMLSVASGAVWQVFLFGEFPQLLATGLLALGLAFEKRPYISGLFLGLCSLAHPLIGPIGALFAFYLAIRARKAAILFTCLPIFALWSARYSLIAQNALSGSWGNSTGETGLIPAFAALESILLLSPAIIALAAHQIYRQSKYNLSKNPGILDPLLILLSVTLILTVFQIAPLQRKMFDLLALPIIVLAAHGLHRLKKGRAMAAVVIAGFAILPLHHIHLHSKEPISTPSELVMASLFLKDYEDEGYLIVEDEHRRYGKSELIASQLARKTPMDPAISMLEKPTISYLQQLAKREEILHGGIPDNRTYLMSGNCTEKVIYENRLYRICLLG